MVSKHGDDLEMVYGCLWHCFNHIMLNHTGDDDLKSMFISRAAGAIHAGIGPQIQLAPGPGRFRADSQHGVFDLLE
jgi:hypothetical protein